MKEVTFKVDRIRYWISVGAQPSDRVAWLLGQVREYCCNVAVNKERPFHPTPRIRDRR